jgi:hypothetical protein
MTTTRTTAQIAAEIDARHARKAALSERLATVNADLHTARAARARAIAEGKKGPGAGEIASLAEEGAAIASALALLSEDVATLEAEEQAAQLAEAAHAQADAIEHAAQAVAELDAVLRRAFSVSVAPAFDAYLAAMKTARNAENTVDRLKRQASTEELPVLPGAAEKVIRRRTRLLGLVADLRAFTEARE